MCPSKPCCLRHSIPRGPKIEPLQAMSDKGIWHSSLPLALLLVRLPSLSLVPSLCAIAPSSLLRSPWDNLLLMPCCVGALTFFSRPVKASPAERADALRAAFLLPAPPSNAVLLLPSDEALARWLSFLAIFGSSDTQPWHVFSPRALFPPLSLSSAT